MPQATWMISVPLKNSIPILQGAYTSTSLNPWPVWKSALAPHENATPYWSNAKEWPAPQNSLSIPLFHNAYTS